LRHVTAGETIYIVIGNNGDSTLAAARGQENYAQLSTHERCLAREDFTAHGRRIHTSDLERSVG
jgi:hypothetical protein